MAAISSDLLECLLGPKPLNVTQAFSAAQSFASTPRLPLVDKAPVLRAAAVCVWLTRKQRGALARLAEQAEKARESYAAAAAADDDDDDDDGNGCPTDIDEDYWEDHDGD